MSSKTGEEQKRELAEALVRHKQLKLQNSQLLEKYLEIKEELREHEYAPTPPPPHPHPGWWSSRSRIFPRSAGPGRWSAACSSRKPWGKWPPTSRT